MNRADRAIAAAFDVRYFMGRSPRETAIKTSQLAF
jgi:hypothetical protein